MSTSLAKTSDQKLPGPVTLRSLVSSPAYQSRFKEVLGEKAQQFCTSLINVGNTMQDVEPNSIIQSAMIAAALDLPVDKNLGFAWIVPFKKHGEKFAQFQMGFKGYIQLGLRTGQYKRMNARAVNSEVFAGWDEVGEPKLDWDKLDESKPAAGYVFGFQLVNGYTKICYWTKARVEEHARRYSQSFKGGYDSPWKTHFDEMAMKTVIKNELSRWGIMSIQMQEAIAKDQAVIDVEGSVSYPDNEPAQAFTSPKPLLSAKAPVTTEPAASEPTPDAPVAAEVEAQETPNQEIARTLSSSGVTFDDFRDFIATKGLIKQADKDSIGSYDDLPTKVAERLKASTMTLAECVKKFGKIQHSPSAAEAAPSAA